jgi:DNA-binding NarL/FixJ family response regulator
MIVRCMPVGASTAILAALSRRKRQVLRLIGAGRTSKEIAYELHLTIGTIGSYRKQICQKLNIHSTAGLISYALGAFYSTPSPGD